MGASGFVHAGILSAGLAGALALAGCGVDSDHPLTGARDSTSDAALVGEWTGSDGKGSFFVGRDEAEPNGLELVSVELTPEGFVRVERGRLYTTATDGTRYASLNPWGKGGPWAILRYEVAGDVARVRFLERGVVAAEIEAGRLEGTVERRSVPVDVGGLPVHRIPQVSARITASPAEIAAFLKAAPAGLWGEPVEFRRVVRPR